MHRLQGPRGDPREADGVGARPTTASPPPPPVPTPTSYRGRFAPTPNGPLHFGSVVAALASYLEARRRAGEWYVRLDDIDRYRVVDDAADRILRDLERLGLHWDGSVTRQSDRIERYDAALRDLAERGWTYPCGCSRKEVGRGPYPGTCRDGLPRGKRARALRIRTGGAPVAFADAVLGPVTEPVAAATGDFIVRRADGVHAYHLAMVVDDADLGITEVVRGADLLPSTGPQIHLQRALALPTPAYAHVPVATDAAGEKLAKQTRAAPIAGLPPGAVIADALAFLGQAPPRAMRSAAVTELLRWGIAHWRLERVPPVPLRQAPAYTTATEPPHGDAGDKRRGAPPRSARPT